MKKVVVLGAGLVGKVIAIDLSCNYKVTCVDINRERLERHQKFGLIAAIAAAITLAATMV